MYLDFFMLTAKPFQITTDPKFLWLGEKHKEALATLRYGIQDNRGFLLLTGEVGTGKTILINRLISMLDIDTAVATLPDPDLESMDFYNLLANGFRMNRVFDSKGAFLIHLRDFLHQSYADQKQVLLIIDESQRLNHRLMEDIRVLSNIELQDRKLINIFFVGQPEFNSILMTPHNRALAQRITVRYHIEALDHKETGEYINHRLRVAGSKRPIFKITALNEVYKFSGGIPRLINIVCDHALLTAYGKNLKQIDANIIKECAGELRIPEQEVRSDAATLRSETKETGDDGSVSVSESSAPDTGLQEEPAMPLKEPVTPEESKLPVVWRISYLAVILLLLGTLVVAITQYAGGPEPRYGDSDLTPQKYKTTLENEKARLADQLAQSTPTDRQNPPMDAKPSAGSAAATAETAEKKPRTSRKEDKATSSTAIESETITDSRQDKAQPAGNVAPVKQEAISEIQAAPSGEVQIERLPLMKENAIIQFDINSNEIDNESYPLLDRIARYLAEHPRQAINIRGYTDSSGSPGYNETVSIFRANAVKSYLIGKGAYPEKISVFAMGDTNPIASNETLAGRKKNRRVEIEFIESPSPGN